QTNDAQYSIQKPLITASICAKPNQSACLPIFMKRSSGLDAGGSPNASFLSRGTRVHETGNMNPLVNSKSCKRATKIPLQPDRNRVPDDFIGIAVAYTCVYPPASNSTRSLSMNAPV